MTGPAQGPPVNVPIRRTAHCIMSFLQMIRREASSDQQIFLAAGGDRTRDLDLAQEAIGYLASSAYAGDLNNTL